MEFFHYLSKFIWSIIILSHIGHGLIIFGFFIKPLENLAGSRSDFYGYFITDDVSMQILEHFGRLTAVVEIAMAAAAFALGDSKLCYVLLGLQHVGSVLAIKNSLTPSKLGLEFIKESHAKSLEIGTKVMIALCLLTLLGFWSTTSKKDTSIQQSSSICAKTIVNFCAAAEMITALWIMVDTEKAWEQFCPGMHFGGMTSVGHGVACLLCDYCALCIVASSFMLISLKPTRVSALLSSCLHFNIFIVGVAGLQQIKRIPTGKLASSFEKCHYSDAIFAHGISTCLLLLATKLAKNHHQHTREKIK